MLWELLKILAKRPKTLPAVNLLELVVAVAFIAIIFTAGFSVFDLSLDIVNRARQSTMAELLAQDLVELTISKRNEGWDSLVPGIYYLVENPDPDIGFEFIAGSETIGEFTRAVTISSVNRDASGNITTSGGTTDPNTMLIHASISWNSQIGIETIDLYEYLTNWNSF